MSEIAADMIWLEQIEHTEQPSKVTWVVPIEEQSKATPTAPKTVEHETVITHQVCKFFTSVCGLLAELMSSDEFIEHMRDVYGA